VQRVPVDPCLSPEERKQVLKWLDESETAFLKAIDDVSAAQWKWKAAPEQWSIGETAEHVVIAEALLFGMVGRAMTTPSNPEWEEQTKGKTELLINTMPYPEQGKAVAPDPILPREAIHQTDVAKRFQRQRIEIVKFAGETDRPLKAHTFRHPFPEFGILSAYQWFIYVPLHTKRHCQQIARIKALADFPSTGNAGQKSDSSAG
jgi:hypothetical protein